MRATDRIVLALMLLGACSKTDQTPASPDCCAEDLATGAVSETSLYNLDASWRDQSGGKRKLSDVRGKVQVVAMVFTHCNYACPRILSDLKAIESQLEPDAKLGFLLASFDTERDLPDTLASYAQENDLSPEKWTLLHGSAGPVRELAAALGVKYKKTVDGGFSHSNVITVLDAGGEIVHQQKGLGTDPGPTLTAIREQLSAHQ